jgi:hypothetical protein
VDTAPTIGFNLANPKEINEPAPLPLHFIVSTGLSDKEDKPK